MGYDVARYRSKFITRRASREEPGKIFVDLATTRGHLAFISSFPVADNIAITAMTG
jgi:hypothetical protein